MHDVFISLSGKDKDWGDWIAWQVQEAGYTVLYQHWHFQAGQNFLLHMEAAGKAARVLVLVSPSYFESEYTQREMTQAVARDPSGRDGVVIPIIVRPCDLRGSLLGPLSSIDLTSAADNEDRARSLLLEGLKQKGPPVRSPGYPGRAKAATEPGPGFPPVVDTVLRAYSQRVLNDPRLTRFDLEQRFVRMRVLLDKGADTESGQWADGGIDAGDLPELLDKLQGMAQASAVVLLGAPGAGKSVLLRHLQRVTAQALITNGTTRIPFFVSLNAYRHDSPEPLAWLRERWAEEAHELPAFDQMRRHGRVLLMGDALNEMGHTGDLEARIDRWRAMLPDFVKDGNRAVFTCRAIDIGGGLTSPELPVPQAIVQPLSPPQIHDFLRRYAPDRADRTFDRIGADPRQMELYATPFFLDLLVKQIRPDGTLPESRAALFAGFIRAALRREIDAKHPLFVEKGIGALLQQSDREWLRNPRGAHPHELPTSGPLIGSLSALAYRMQRNDPRLRNRQVSAREQDALALMDHPRGADILEAALRLNLLEKIFRSGGADVQFSHQLFQEFFAARLLGAHPEPSLAATEWRAAAIAPGVRELLATRPRGERLAELDATGWEETAQVAVVMTPDPDAFVGGLMTPNLPLAGRCSTAPGVRVSEGVKIGLRDALVARSRDGAADLRARIDAALALGPLGDPRFERRTGPFGDYLVPPVVAIRAGVYRIGDNMSVHADEKPEIDVPIDAFRIGRFAVTNAEYQLFVDAGGYNDERWWETAAARAWREGRGTAEGQRQQWRENWSVLQSWPDSRIPEQLEAGMIGQDLADSWIAIRGMSETELEAWLSSEFKDERQDHPRFADDSSFNAPLQPVVGVCWHEARAYCAWLSAQSPRAHRAYRLPTEHEWEAAARGQSRRQFAYEGAFDPTRGNTLETRLKRTTPAGVFPDGDTPEEVSDMTGNTWEWTLSPYEDRHRLRAGEIDLESEARRVVRGGSWLNSSVSARATCRGSSAPGDRYFLLGFRVVCVSPIP